MTVLEGDIRIQYREVELARVQAEESTYRQIESNLVRNSLKQTLLTAASLARVVNEVIATVGGCIEGGVEKVAVDLTGKSDR